MLFNSISYLFFFPFVCILYWCLPYRYRNCMLLIASYYFYMNWQPAYALLILLSTTTTWFCAIKMNKASNTNKFRRKIYLSLCILFNLSILFVFKYLNFITEFVFSLLELCNLRMPIPHFDLLLPVGISFYTFQAIGYTIDVYKEKIEAEKSFYVYALFVSFFPQLVAGPIERAANLLCQFHKKHTFDANQFIEGLKLMVWGYFMKLCIAENVAPYVNAVYNNIPNHNGTSILLATFFFTFQIFCDFGGYSLIAIGTARCLNFTLMQNFNRPYLTTSMRDFWRRWHISLSSWFTEYVYIPLGGNRCSKIKNIRNLMVTMLVSGAWHGANWTFILWGGYHGILLVINKLFSKTHSPSWTRPLKVVICFFLIMIGWVFFRANSMGDAMSAYYKMFFIHGSLYHGEGIPSLTLPIVLIALLMFKEIKDEIGIGIHLMSSKNLYISAFWTGLMIVITLLCAKFESGQFIYFQF